MDIEELREYCLKKRGTTEGFPFGEDVLVMKVIGKVFAMIAMRDFPLRMNLKCDPELALELRERYDAVLPGYHCNKKHWNTILLDGGIPKREILEMIDHSYQIVAKGLKKGEREKLGIGIDGGCGT